MFLRPKRVRLHLVDVQHSVDGIFLGYVAGHYRVAKPELVFPEGTREADGGPEMWVPRDRVLYVQVLG